MRSSTGIKRLAGALLGGVLALLSLGALSDSAVTQGSRAAGMDSCVAPTAEMRRNHMDYLKHDRVESVRKGVRDTKNSLAGCVDCHASKDDNGGFKPINSEGEFCESCHTYVAVDLACFQCHRKTPEENVSSLKPLTMGAGIDGHALGLLQDAGSVTSLSAEELAHLHAKTVKE